MAIIINMEGKKEFTSNVETFETLHNDRKLINKLSKHYESIDLAILFVYTAQKWLKCFPTRQGVDIYYNFGNGALTVTKLYGIPPNFD